VTVFEALADETRRSIVKLLAERERSVTEITTHFSLSQPAISKHLRVLRDAGIADAEINGKRRIYRLRSDGLVDAEAWFAHNRRLWERRVEALRVHTEEA
jgi:DNA-binding transcriptional ArsR family regulator